MTDALDIVNHNLVDVAESSGARRQQIKTVQETEEALGIGDILGSGDSLSVQRTSVLESLQQYSQQAECHERNSAACVQSINSDASACSCASETTCLAADDGEMAAATSDRSSPKSAASSAEVARDRRIVARLFSDEKHQTDADSKTVGKLQKSVTSSTPKKTESSFVGKKVGPSSNVTTTRQPTLTARRSSDVNSSRSSAPLSTSVSSKPVALSQRRPSVPKQTVKQHAVTAGSGKQQTQTQGPESSAASSLSSSTLLPDHKTNSESSLAAGGDFGSDLPVTASLRSSTPVTSLVGDSNNTSRSISRVSSISDTSSPSASCASTGAFSTPVRQLPQQSMTKGKPQHLFILL